jgi:hypothetical protein
MEYCLKLTRRGTYCVQYKEERLTGLVTSCLGTASKELYSGKDRRKDRR